MDKTEALLKDITTVVGVPGYENEVRAVIRRYLSPVSTIEHDNMTRA